MSSSRIRVVSLVPSSTETLLALGADVVACTRFCEQPNIRHVGGTKNPNVDAIVDLAPDLVVMDREENRREDADALKHAGMTLHVSNVQTVDDARRLVVDLSALIGVAAPTADEQPLPPGATSVRRKVFVPIWRRPWMSIGADTYGSSILEHLGYDLVTFGSDPYPTITLADVGVRDPDVIVVPSEPYEFTDAHLDEMRSAIPAADIVRVDGRDLFWWGIRTPAAIARLSGELAGRV